MMDGWQAWRAGVRAASARVALVLALTLVAGALEVARAQSGSTAAPSPKLQALIDGAKKEGQFTFYASVADPIAAALAKGFQDQYKISTSYLRFATTDLEIRYERELQAGAPSADAIIVSSGDGFADKLIKSGLMADPKAADIPDLDAYPKSLYSQGAAIVGAEALGIAYNSTLVDKKDVPSDWTDLAGPKWAGKILLVNPATSVGNLLPLLVLRQKYGDDFIKAFAKNVYEQTPGIVPNFEALGAGEGSIGVTSLASVAKPLAEKGAPVVHVTLPFAPLLDHSLGLTAKPVHPNTQKLFAWYVMVGPGQQIINDPARWGRSSPVTGLNMPKEAVAMDNALLKDADNLKALLGSAGKK